MLNMLALALLTQAPSEDVLKKAGLSVHPVIEAKDGRAEIPGGVVVDFLGACRLNTKTPKPWDMSGLPVNAPTAQWFWYALGINPKDSKVLAIWGDDHSERNFAVSFRIRGKASVHLPLSSLQTLNILSSSSQPPKPGLGYNHSTQSLQLEAPGPHLDIPLEVALRSPRDLLTLDPKAPAPQGFKMELKSQVVNGFRATAKKREEFKIRRYLIALSIPKEWIGVPLQMRTSDDEAKPSKGEFPILTSGKGFDGSQMAPEYKGKILFMLEALEKPAYKRTFVLFATPTYRVNFSAIPTKPVRQ